MLRCLKRYIVLILAAAILCGFSVVAEDNSDIVQTSVTASSTTTASTTAPSLKLTASWNKSAYCKGDTAVLSLYLSGADMFNISAFDFSVVYSSKNLSVVSADKAVSSYSAGAVLPNADYFSVSIPKAGRLRLLYVDESANQSQPISQNGNLCKITFTVKSNAKVGNYVLNLDNDGSFSDPQMKPCKIRMYDCPYSIKKNLKNCTISKISNKTFTGRRIKPKLTVKSGSTTLTSGKDYSVKYSNNLNTGTAKAVVSGKGSYAGSKTVRFKIVKKNISKCNIAQIPKQAFTGKAVKPSVSVKSGKTKLKKNVHYKVKFKNNKKMGKATVTLTGIGSLKGSVVKNFRIAPARVKLKNTKIAGRSLKLSWKQSKGATGYQLQYRVNKNKKIKTVNLKKVRAYSIKNLKKGSSVKFRIRALRKSGKITHYSPYTKYITAKVK